MEAKLAFMNTALWRPTDKKKRISIKGFFKIYKFGKLK